VRIFFIYVSLSEGKSQTDNVSYGNYHLHLHRVVQRLRFRKDVATWLASDLVTSRLSAGSNFEFDRSSCVCDCEDLDLQLGQEDGCPSVGSAGQIIVGRKAVKFDPDNTLEENLAIFQQAAEALDPDCAKILFENLAILQREGDDARNKAARVEFSDAVLKALETLPDVAETAKP
jgi:hypothetical protein